MQYQTNQSHESPLDFLTMSKKSLNPDLFKINPHLKIQANKNINSKMQNILYLLCEMTAQKLKIIEMI